MEEKIKENNFSTSKFILDDKNVNDNIIGNIKGNSTFVINPSNKLDHIYKIKELNKFKEEILSYISERDNYYSEKIKKLQTQLDNNNNNFEKLSGVIETNKNNYLSKQVDIMEKFGKLKVYDAFMNKANDKLISHEIRLNCLREDLTKSNQKYDKIYLENLELPGYIGRSSKYPNCKIFFTEMIKEMDKFNNYKEKNTIDLNTYKERLENIIKTFQSIVENNNDSQIKYITKLNNKTNKSMIEMMEEKIKYVRLDNSHFAVDLIKKSNELNILYNKMNLIKEYILQEFKNISDKYNKQFEENNKLFDEYKVEYEIIKRKFLELADFIKNGKLTKNFGGILGRKDINLISRKLNRDLKDTIDAKDVKLLNNIEDINKIDFNSNTTDYKPNNNNNKNARFSKSQNSFNNHNNLGKKRTFGFGNNNIQKKRYSTENQKNNFKFSQGTLYYYTGKNLTDNNSVKNLSKKKGAFKNNLNFENLKNIKNNLKPKEIPKSERQSESKKENIIRKISKEKVNNDYLEEIKGIKLRKEEKKKRNFNINNDELSITESYISNLNNSINTFSTTNEKNNSFTSINLNNNKVGKFNLFESNLEHNDKIIKEIASDLEQSTAKGNKLASLKKEMEENFKTICNKIQPVNLKLSNHIKLKKIDEYIEKNNNNIINKSEQNTSLFSHNLNNNVENSNSNISISNNILCRNNKLKELIDLTEKLEENNSITSNNKNNNEICFSDIDQKMSIYDKKLGDLESFTREQIIELIKQINLLKNNYLFLTNVVKKENNLFKLNGFNTINAISKASHSRPNIFNKNVNKNLINNENKNTLNLTTNYFYKKTPTIEVNPKLSAITKKDQNSEDINLSDNLFYNGKYYFNIKDILGQKKEKKMNKNFENKKLLKTIDNKNIVDKNSFKNKIFQNNSYFEKDIENK